MDENVDELVIEWLRQEYKLAEARFKTMYVLRAEGPSGFAKYVNRCRSVGLTPAQMADMAIRDKLIEQP